MKPIVFLGTLLIFLVFSSTAKATGYYGSFNDTFNTADNWTNSSMFGDNPAKNYGISPAGVMMVEDGTIRNRYTTTVPLPYIFKVDVKYDTAPTSVVMLRGGYRGEDYVFIGFYWNLNAVAVVTDGADCKGSAWKNYSFTYGKWYNLTIVGKDVAEVYVNGTLITYLNFTDKCYLSKWITLSAYGKNVSRFDNLYWYQIPRPRPENYILDVGVISATEYDQYGCNLELQGATVSVYDGTTEELIDSKTPNIYKEYCCKANNETYGCHVARFAIPTNITSVIIEASAPNYEPETMEEVFDFPHIGVNFFLLRKGEIFRYEGNIVDHNTLKPIGDGVVCVFFSNNTSPEGFNCLSTADTGEFNFFLKPGEYYLTATATNYECVITPNFYVNQSTKRTVYLKPDSRPWYVILEADRMETDGNTPVNFRAFVCRSSATFLRFEYETEGHRVIEPYQVFDIQTFSNPLFFSRHMKYCGLITAFVTYGYREGVVKESNRVQINVRQPCERPYFPGMEFLDTKPYADLRGYLPSEVEWVNYFLTPPLLISIFVFGIAGLVASKIGGEKKGVVFLVASTIIFFVLSFTGVLPKWILIILGIGGGVLIMNSLKHKEAS